MSRFITEKDGKIVEEIESMEVCKWNINEVCCNDKSDCLGDYPYPSFICQKDKKICEYFEEEDGKVEK